jgi:hypothetical protein
MLTRKASTQTGKCVSASEISSDQTNRCVVLSKDAVQAETYRSGLPAADLRSGGLLSRRPLPTTDKPWAGLVHRIHVFRILFDRWDYRSFHRAIRQRPAVSGFVPFGERLALLADALISAIRTRTGMNEIVELGRACEPGQEVEITQGLFRGLKALVPSTHHGSRARRTSHRMDGPHPACRSGRHRFGALGARCRMLSNTLMTAIHLNAPLLTGTRPLITSNSRKPKSTENMCECPRTHGLKDTIERRSAMMVVRLKGN